jgi:hypothetical protein
MNNNDFINELRLDREHLATQETFIEKKKREYCIDRNIDYPDPDYLIEIGGVPTMPKGNLVALSAKWKNGKTFFCDILSAVFLGSNYFGGVHSLKPTGKVQFFDTEQAVSDTARILKVVNSMTSEQRHDDIKVYCLRNACIENPDNNIDDISRLDFISHTIASDRPDLVIIDGIADLIYNYNDVIESQTVVNSLAALANENDCCIVVVMHQNKSKQDKAMKGHLGTMLFQKCSDVFSVEKCDSLFVASHTVSRHRNCEDIVFKLDANAVPIDAVADRQLQIEMEHQRNENKLREMLTHAVPEDGSPVKRSEAADLLVENFPFKRAKAYQLLNDFVKRGWLIEVDRSTVKMHTPNRQIDE